MHEGHDGCSHQDMLYPCALHVSRWRTDQKQLGDELEIHQVSHLHANWCSQWRWSSSSSERIPWCHCTVWWWQLCSKCPCCVASRVSAGLSPQEWWARIADKTPAALFKDYNVYDLLHCWMSMRINHLHVQPLMYCLSLLYVLYVHWCRRLVSLSHRYETGKGFCFEEALSSLGQSNLPMTILQSTVHISYRATVRIETFQIYSFCKNQPISVSSNKKIILHWDTIYQ